jgi:hypothetical protein
LNILRLVSFDWTRNSSLEKYLTNGLVAGNRDNEIGGYKVGTIGACQPREWLVQYFNLEDT